MTITDVSDRPEAGSSECNLASGVCVLCNDGDWHCGSDTLPQCAYAPPRSSCPSPNDDIRCFACAGGSGAEWVCQPTSLGLQPSYGWVQTDGGPCIQ